MLAICPRQLTVHAPSYLATVKATKGGAKDNVKISDEMYGVTEPFWWRIIIEMILNKLNSLISSSFLK